MKNSINFSFISQIGSKFTENSLDSYKRASRILIKSGNNVSKLVSNNSKPILFSFLGLSSLIISTKLITYYLNQQFALKNKKEKREYIQFAESKLQENDLNGALKAYFKSIEIPSSYKSSLEDRNAYKGIAKIKLKQKKYDDASEYFSKIIDNIRLRHLSNWGLKSDKVELYYNRGLSNYYSKKYEYSKNIN